MQIPDKLRISRRYYIGGFFCLPLLWIVNSIWFFRDAFYDYHNFTIDDCRLMRKHVLVSMIGSLIWIILLISWIIFYRFALNNKNESLANFADYISFIIPRG